jgi:hypothetical protein
MRNVMAATLLVLALPLAGDVIDAHELRRPERAMLPRAAGSQLQPVVASGSSTWLGAWIDTRGGGQELYGTTVTRDGIVVNPLGINIAYPDYDVQFPAIAWDGSAYVAIWRSDYKLRMMRVSERGERLDPEPRTVFDELLDVRPLAIASKENGVVVAALRRVSGRYSIELAAFDRNGLPVATSKVPSYDVFGLSLAPTRTGFTLFALDGSKKLQGWSLDARAQLQATQPVSIDGEFPWGFRSATSRDRVLITWMTPLDHFVRGMLGDGTTFGDPFIFAKNGDYDYALSGDDEGFDVAFGRETGRIEVPPAGDLLVQPQPTFDLDSVELSREGVVSAVRPLVAGPDSEISPALARAGGRTFVLYRESLVKEASPKIAAAIAADRALAAPLSIALSQRAQHRPAIASGDEGDLVVYREEPDNAFKGVIVARMGTRRAIVSGVEGNHSQPSVAWNHGHFLVTWIEAYQLLGRFVDRHGNVEGEPFSITLSSDVYTHPAIAPADDGFLIAWASARQILGRDEQQIAFAHIDDRGGVRRISGLVESHGTLRSSELAFVRSGSLYVLGWTSYFTVELATIAFNATSMLTLNRTTTAGRPWEGPAVDCNSSSCQTAGLDDRSRIFVSSLAGGSGQSRYLPATDVHILLDSLGRATLLYKSFDQFGTWQPETDIVTPRFSAHILGPYAASIDRDGAIVVAYEAPVEAAGGVTRIQVARFLP